MPAPTIADALARAREDPAARFAVLLAGTFAFSLGFAFGFALGQAEAAEGGASEDEAS